MFCISISIDVSYKRDLILTHHWQISIYYCYVNIGFDVQVVFLFIQYE